MGDVQDFPTSDGFIPSDEDRASVAAWFAKYDAFAAKQDFEAMADMAMFPLNEVTDNGAGNGQAEQCSREQYLAQMAQVMGGSGDDVTMQSTRTPHFISGGLVFVITEGTVTYGGQTQPMRYGDLLVKKDGQWLFQTMVQGGWGGNSDT
ncbi:MAG: nuclear transport factor 2 family protein [Pseudonocardiaceae bacterium]